MNWLYLLVSLAALGLFLYRRLLTYLQYFQQEEYDGPRFLRWLCATGAFDRKLSAVLLGLAVLALFLPPALYTVASAAAVVGFALREADPRQTGKKRLVMTSRARRIFILSIAVALLAGLSAVYCLPFIGWIVAVQFAPLALAAGNLALTPFENSVQKRYWNEAHDKIGALKPKVIAVTGSYGKTSVKHILGHLLQMSAPTLITPGSVNTPMGVSRIIREQLEARHRYFVVEMGAYGPGSIARLCRLVPPTLGIITAIGKAHFERFKSLETVARTKYELAEAAVGQGGRVIVAADTLDYSAARDFHSRNAGKVVVCGGEGSELALSHIRMTPDGVALDVMWEGKSYALAAPIHGLHHAWNVALAFAACCLVGMSPEDVQMALKTTPQIPHRLEIKPQPNGVLLIDDAYNSNPEGFAAALSLLDFLRKPRGRRILVTPGMVELGAAHDEEHARLGKMAGDCADILVAVNGERIPTLIDAFSAGKPADQVIQVSRFAEAQAWLNANLRPDDVVLLENDLPDLLEKKLRL
jgi:UDP-N-acetylmuramoyl-tripeptide--D-alanyl-D-alanine ligase